MGESRGSRTAWRSVAAAGIGLAAAALVILAVRAIGETVPAVVYRASGAVLRWQAVLWATVLGGRLLWFVGGRARVQRSLVALTATVTAAAWLYHAMRPRPPWGRPWGTAFGGLVTLPANGWFVDDFPHRPRVRIRIGSDGFRGPSFTDAKPPGTTRLALLGDSFVFGSGVEWPDTLAMTLQTALEHAAPGRRFQVLDLGIAGDHLLSDVSEYREVERRFAPDAVVLGLGYFDLSARDIQAIRHAEWKSPWFHLAAQTLGTRFAEWAWMMSGRPPDLSEAEKVTGTAATELLRLRRHGGPPLFVLEYHSFPPGADQALRAVPGLSVVELSGDDPAWWIPIDGHPTPAGNRVFAAALAPRILASLPVALR